MDRYTRHRWAENWFPKSLISDPPWLGLGLVFASTTNKPAEQISFKESVNNQFQRRVFSTIFATDFVRRSDISKFREKTLRLLWIRIFVNVWSGRSIYYCSRHFENRWLCQTKKVLQALYVESLVVAPSSIMGTQKSTWNICVCDTLWPDGIFITNSE